MAEGDANATRSKMATRSLMTSVCRPREVNETWARGASLRPPAEVLPVAVAVAQATDWAGRPAARPPYARAKAGAARTTADLSKRLTFLHAAKIAWYTRSSMSLTGSRCRWRRAFRG